ncbi:MAG TPA: WecB/TagA/CpsF family glycosyltransferase [Terracidiphilus sp.]|nr:WecB/TagA/CpsF family glycosyltransferase [Terracidiphilus sp.]
MDTLLATPYVSEAQNASATRTNVLGVQVSVLNMERTVALCDALIRSNGKGYVCVTDVHGIIEAQDDPAFRGILNNSYMTTPDGMPLVWTGRMQGHSAMRRVYGPDLLMALCAVSAERGYRHVFFGGKPGVADLLAEKLCAKFPGLQVVGTYVPPFRPLTEEEEKDLETRMDEARPDILWVGLGLPKQERFMARYCGRLNVNLMIGVGAAFDIHAGLVKEAPQWLKKLGLQWLHRLCQEPRRLWRRYMICIPRFLWGIGLQFLSGARERA